MVLVSLTTAYDIRSIAMARDLSNLSSQAAPCGDWERSDSSRVYDSFGPIESWEKQVADVDSLGAPKQGKVGEHRYQVWFNYKTEGRMHLDRNVDYDFTSRPQDVCLRIAGNPYLDVGIGLISATAVISKQKISEVLKPLTSSAATQ